MYNMKTDGRIYFLTPVAWKHNPSMQQALKEISATVDAVDNTKEIEKSTQSFTPGVSILQKGIVKREFTFHIYLS